MRPSRAVSLLLLWDRWEHLSVVVLGHPQRGDPDTEEQLDRVSGDGWVAAKDGDYADALAKGHTVILLVTESTGAFSADLDRVLRQLARTARASEASGSRHARFGIVGLRRRELCFALSDSGIWRW
ncbi:hypothetical protein EMIHUDRAFT_454997 [Emiliania huxleyi CCMP1516]|uniref:DUF5615 domain-containing protein n=2 Tax=Emiliania huxleyi TaxID=2903 RepID=A0A0D3KMR8_EMIH1|nr:hypothetical protein EMIHUDRAFT_454997 [Emiliania huxleyi CCMP1516]EOD37053.1 hypothetical protein EMIHUDRAFT_454997 [Emiliania huxleyi CCMP1516]|eukprot:XP_005789482.1 hypothetical protein EMIHUDRAFT_454997 [Emiliania huxleyi CCMP1516]